MAKRNKGDVCVLGTAAAWRLQGVRVEVVRQSRLTGVYTVQLLEDAPKAPAYEKGTEISVTGYELADS